MHAWLEESRTFLKIIQSHRVGVTLPPLVLTVWRFKCNVWPKTDSPKHQQDQREQKYSELFIRLCTSFFVIDSHWRFNFLLSIRV